jgi:acetolactate synthase-1/2/3 large subunit
VKGYEAIARAVQHYSDAPVFGVMGNANMLIFSTLAAEGDDRLVSARHEAAAVAMADGYARSSGKVGVSTVTSGPGLSQVATSLLAAARYRSPQVLIAGDAFRRDAARLQAFDQSAFAATCESGFVPIRRVEDIVPAVHEAFAQALLESRPVLLSIPEDLQFEEASPDVLTQLDALARPRRSVAPVPQDHELDRLLDRLEAAERPVFVVGREARSAETVAAVRALAEHYGALLATSLPAKGAVDDDEWSVGVSGGFAHTGARPLLQQADLVVGFAAGLASYTTDKMTLYPSAQFVRIDLRQTTESAMLGHDVLLGDVDETVPRLLGMARTRSKVRENFRGASERELVSRLRTEAVETIDERPDGLHPAAVVETLRTTLPEGAQVVVGGGHFWAFVVMGVHGRTDLSWQFSYQFGSIGQTLPVAIGMWFGDPTRPLVVIDGDGSVLMHIQELDTVARHQIPMTLVVANDEAFGAEVHKLRPAGHVDSIATFASPDFGAIGRAFGGDGWRVDTIDALGSALAGPVPDDDFRVLDVRISAQVPSEPFRRWYYDS